MSQKSCIPQAANFVSQALKRDSDLSSIESKMRETPGPAALQKQWLMSNNLLTIAARLLDSGDRAEDLDGRCNSLGKVRHKYARMQTTKEMTSLI